MRTPINIIMVAFSIMQFCDGSTSTSNLAASVELDDDSKKSIAPTPPESSDSDDDSLSQRKLRYWRDRADSLDRSVAGVMARFTRMQSVLDDVAAASGTRLDLGHRVTVVAFGNLIGEMLRAKTEERSTAVIAGIRNYVASHSGMLAQLQSTLDIKRDAILLKISTELEHIKAQLGTAVDSRA